MIGPALLLLLWRHEAQGSGYTGDWFNWSLKALYIESALRDRWFVFDRVCVALAAVILFITIPIVLVGSEYWQPLIDVIRGTLLAEGTIDPADLDILRITDSPEEAVAHVREVAIAQFGLKYGAGKARRRWWLFE